MIKKKTNKWKTGTFVLGAILIVMILVSVFTAVNELHKEKERICNTITGTPAWVNPYGRIVAYGVLNSGFKNNQTIINDTELTDNLILNGVTFVYTENCTYCQIQKGLLGEENFNRLVKNKLTLNCNG